MHVVAITIATAEPMPCRIVRTRILSSISSKDTSPFSYSSRVFCIISMRCDLFSTLWRTWLHTKQWIVRTVPIGDDIPAKQVRSCSYPRNPVVQLFDLTSFFLLHSFRCNHTSNGITGQLIQQIFRQHHSLAISFSSPLFGCLAWHVSSLQVQNGKRPTVRKGITSSRAFLHHKVNALGRYTLYSNGSKIGGLQQFHREARPEN